MTLEEFKENVVGIEIDTGAFEGEVCVSGPWNPRYLLDMRLEVDGRKIGAHVEFVLEERDEPEVGEWEDCIEVIESLECFGAYDMEGLDDDVGIDDGKPIPQEGAFFESVLDAIAARIGCYWW